MTDDRTSTSTANGHPQDADHGGEADHGESLGPIDMPAWAAGAAGVLLGLVVVACLVVATGGLGA